MFRSLLLFSILLFGRSSVNAAEVSVVFYNVENLFDPKVDTINKDKEFTPEAKKQWDEKKLRNKINGIAQVINSLRDSLNDSLPSIIGLAEVENRRCLELLKYQSLLKNENYQILHQDAPGHRGIDVALLYKEKLWNPIGIRYQPVLAKKKPSRDILIFSAIYRPTGDTLSFLVNHWPSRYGGKKKSESKRIQAGKILASCLDSLQKKHPQGIHISMGDFNDETKDSSLMQLGAQFTQLQFHPNNPNQLGSIKYKRRWQLFDLFAVLPPDHQAPKIYSNVYRAEWLLERDTRYGGTKVFRTYYGPQFHGGISDHLPVFLRFSF